MIVGCLVICDHSCESRTLVHKRLDTLRLGLRLAERCYTPDL